jgi:hypothetical protein
MSRIRTLGVAALVLSLAAMVSSVRAADENKKKEHAIHGVVVKVEKDADKDSGSFTVKIQERKAKGADTKTADATAAEEMKFKVTTETKFLKVSRKKKADAAAAADAKAEPESTPATFADLKDGDVVAVEANDGVAVTVKFHAPRKKKAA